MMRGTKSPSKKVDLQRVVDTVQEIIHKGNSIAVGEMDVHVGKGSSCGMGISTYKL